MNTEQRAACAFSALVALAGSAGAQTITVTTPLDVVDVDWNTATIDDLPGPDGVVSLREALIASDNTAGHQIVGFEIPEEDWYLSDIFPGLVLIQGNLNWSALEPVTIDGTTQTAFTGDTNPGGWEVVLQGLTLYLGGDNSTIFGLHSSRISLDGSNSEVRDNTGPMYIQLYTGSGSQIHDNEAGTIKLQGTHHNVIVRNTAERIRIWGNGAASPSIGNRIGGPDVADRNYITGWGNYGEHGYPAGTTLEISGTQDTLVQNNYIGTTPDGMSIGNRASTAGIGIQSDNRNLMIRDNLIAIWATHASGNGVFGTPIYLDSYDGSDGIYIFGNTLGLNANGEAVLGGKHGIWVNRDAVESVVDVHIGGTNPGEGNVIAGHASTGVLMENSPGIQPASGIRVSGNSIYDNDEIGIDLMPDTWTFGPTLNDALDTDAGANGLQNYPDVLAATFRGSTIRLVGVLNSEPFGDYTLEFFASPHCHPSGFGEGELFLGSTTVTSGASGNAAFDHSVPAQVPVGWVVTATATSEPTGATSEFSACTPILPGERTFRGFSDLWR